MRKRLLVACLTITLGLSPTYTIAANPREVVINAWGSAIAVSLVGIIGSSIPLSLYLKDQYINGYYYDNGSASAQALCCQVTNFYFFNCVAQSQSSKPPCAVGTSAACQTNGVYSFGSPVYTEESRRAQIISGTFLAFSGISLVASSILYVIAVRNQHRWFSLPIVLPTAPPPAANDLIIPVGPPVYQEPSTPSPAAATGFDKVGPLEYPTS